MPVYDHGLNPLKKQNTLKSLSKQNHVDTGTSSIQNRAIKTHNTCTAHILHYGSKSKTLYILYGLQVLIMFPLLGCFDVFGVLLLTRGQYGFVLKSGTLHYFLQGTSQHKVSVHLIAVFNPCKSQLDSDSLHFKIRMEGNQKNKQLFGKENRPLFGRLYHILQNIATPNPTLIKYTKTIFKTHLVEGLGIIS